MNQITKLLGSNPASRVATTAAIVYELVDIYTKYQSNLLTNLAVVQAIALLVLGFVTNEITASTIYNNRRGQ
jgi:hypothetical protein